MSKILDFDDLEVDGSEGADWEHSPDNPKNYPKKSGPTERDDILNSTCGQALIQGLEEVFAFESLDAIRRSEIELKSTTVELDLSAVGIQLPVVISIAVDVVNCLSNIPVSMASIVSQVGADVKSIYRVVNSLSKAGIVASRKGPGGGTTLLKTDVTIGELYSVFGKTEDVPEAPEKQKPSETLAQQLMNCFNSMKVRR